jgi:DNA-binding MarR family transcriptional regulator
MSYPSGKPAVPHVSMALTEVVHQRTRLGILSVLAESRRADFSYLKSALQLTDGNLGRHLEILANEGLVEITKGHENRRPRTWAQITKVGQSALEAQMAAMKELVHRFETRNSSSSIGVSKATKTQRQTKTAQSPPKLATRRTGPKLSGA